MITVNDLMLYFNLAMVGIVVIFALWGLFAGFKREIKCFIGLLVILGLGWIIFGNPKLVLDAKIPAFVLSSLPVSGSTLREIALSILQQIPNINAEEVFAEGTQAYKLVMNVVGSIGRTVVLLGVTLLILFVIAPLIRFITFIIGLFMKSGKKGQKGQNGAVKPTPGVVVKDVNGTIVTEDYRGT
jgi:hypothetical protein